MSGGLESLLRVALDEEGEAFRKRLLAAFPDFRGSAPEWKRRDLLKCLGGALALAGLDGCERRPDERAFPYVVQPDGIVLGETLSYATAVELEGVAQPVIGRTRAGRPVKLEGNPDHPASLGATDAFTQAALLGLYDPDRSASPLRLREEAGWDSVDAMLANARAKLDAAGGAGFRLLTGTVTSPTLKRQIASLLKRWPEARWHAFSPVAGQREQALRAAFGRPLGEQLRLDRAEIVVSLDDDLLGPGPRQTFHARHWSARRLGYQKGEGEARLFVAEPTPSLTGAVAEQRLAVGHDRVAALLAALAVRAGIDLPAPPLSVGERSWADAASAALESRRGQGMISVGAHHLPTLQQLALAIDGKYGNLGSTRLLVEPADPDAPEPGTLDELVQAMGGGAVGMLVMLDCNPVHTAPFAFTAALDRVKLIVHAGVHADESAARSHWHLPTAHMLESWSDSIAADGSATPIQPLVKPFLAVRSRHALLAGLIGGTESDHEAVRATWSARWGADGFAPRWQAALVAGRLDDPPAAASPGEPALPSAIAISSDGGLELVVRPDPTIWDGRFAANPWLQELPKPLTKMCWGNGVIVSPALAAELGLAEGRLVRVEAEGASAVGPIVILPGQAPHTVTVHLGYGRALGGKIAEGLGFDAYPLRGEASAWHAAGIRLVDTGDETKLVTTQHHFTMAGHDFVRDVPGPAASLPPEPERASFYPPQHSRPAWGMSIDLDLCIGCNACTIACVAENNIPMVGPEEVAKGRVMHWIRVDNYHEGPDEAPDHAFQPVPCMHCEDAPCEMGCPVNATVHSPDGLNLQVYNRCIGTRTCSAYCPYKVRRFNWVDYTSQDPPALQAARNPEVTVRARGVMEKCTYCVQRIEAARIAAKKADRPISEGEVVTACQQVCPTRAIVFGDVSDEASAVSRRKASGRDYDLLPEANTRPRTTYLARIRDKARRG